MKRILIIGSGDIALQYVLALRELGDFDIDVLSRTFNSASDFCKIHSLNECYGGGIDSLPSIVSQYTGIIIASPIDTLLPYLRLLLDLGFTKILVEKPLALNSSDILPILSMDKSSSVMVALNRLFFPSYVQLRSIVADDPIRSLSFLLPNGFIVLILITTQQRFLKNGAYPIAFTLYPLFLTL